MQTSFYSECELQEIGFLSVGKNVLISRKCSIYSPEKISIGNNVRIDDFCILSGSIKLNSNIHISAYCALYGAKGIELMDYTGMSPRSTIFSAMDDFSGEYLIGPVNPIEKTHVTGGKVILERFVQLGASTIVFPNLILNEGCVTGAFTLVNHDLDSWSIYIGQPARFLKNRKHISLEE